jgi:thiol-disulfide isomerase/thioredoxin
MEIESNLRRYNYRDYWTSDESNAKDTRFSKKSVKSFLNAYLNGRLKRSLFSEGKEEAIRANTQEGKVTDRRLVDTIVGSQFSSHVVDVVENDNIDIIMYVRAPWCAHCKSFDPVKHKVT